MALESRGWVIDTSTYTHLCRAGHAALLADLAPGGVILVPDAVNAEIQRGQERYPDIPGVDVMPWAHVAVLTEDEEWTSLRAKARLGGRSHEHLGECAVIAVAQHRRLVALLDDRAARALAHADGIATHDTLWLVIEAYVTHRNHYARRRCDQIVDDLIANHPHPHHDRSLCATRRYPSQRHTMTGRQTPPPGFQTDMRLPVDCGASLFAWAYRQGYLPRD